MNKIYIFSGLGVDRRVFENINFENLDIEFVDWITPLDKESLEDYAIRISKKIISPNPIIIGLSFGGILATEISKFLKVKKLILIASAKTKYELPFLYRLAGNLRLNKLLPNRVLKHQNCISNWFFGIKTESEKQLLKSILKDTSSEFLSWAIHEIVNWKNEKFPENVIHIHGSKDRIIPIKNVKIDFRIENGGHFMTVNRALEIQKLIKVNCST